jgi:hypothetical protein
MVAKMALEHFIAQVRIGDKLSASYQARAATRLAAAILENVPRMDAEAVEGAILFLELTAKSYRDATEAVQ